MIWLWLACATQPEPDVPGPVTQPVQDPPLVALDAPRLLRRISLDLRGVLPEVEDLNAVEADPEMVMVFRDQWLTDPRLEEQLVLLLGDQWQTRVDEFNLDYFDYQLDSVQEYAFERSVGEEPLRLAAHIVVNGNPWHELVNADYTVANELLADIWSLSYPEGESGWQVSHYTDGRPPVGVLASNGLWWRYWTGNFNYNRTRAAAIFRLLLCEDLLDREVSFSSSPSLLDVDGTTSALRNDPACVNCHANIDPVAATLFGFWWFDLYDTAELTDYHPDRELMGEGTLGTEMAWFGQPLDGLYALGAVVGTDPRFSQCAVETFASGLWFREPELSDFARMDRLHQGFLANDMQVIPLLAEITDTLTYQAGGLGEDAAEEDGARELLRRPLSPARLSSVVEELTGFSWTWEGFDQLDNDDIGFRTMAGGVDGFSVTEPQLQPGVTWSLVVRRTAQAAAAHVVTSDLAVAKTDRRLLQLVSEDSEPGDSEFEAQLRMLYWQFYAERPGDDWLGDISALWSLGAESSTEAAWGSVISVMLQDPRFVTQ